MNERIKELALQARINSPDGFKLTVNHMTTFRLERFAALVEAAARADEREECAELCDGLADTHEKLSQWSSHKTADTLAQAIRARGTT